MSSREHSARRPDGSREERFEGVCGPAPVHTLTDAGTQRAPVFLRCLDHRVPSWVTVMSVPCALFYFLINKVQYINWGKWGPCVYELPYSFIFSLLKL